MRGSRFLKLMGTLILLAVAGNGQDSSLLRREIRFSHDNDALLWQGKDGYYSAGTMLGFQWASLRKERRILQGLTLTQQIFTTRERHTFGVRHEPFDRPYCGYLGLGYERRRFLHTDEMLGWGLNLGVVGEWSQGANLQLWLHKLMDLYYYNFWKGQIPNEAGLDFALHYRKLLIVPPQASAGFAMMAGADGRLGTFFIQAEPSICLAYGRLTNLASSSLVNATVGSAAPGGRKRELYAFVEPHLLWQGYNVTVQGGRFNHPDLGTNWDSIMGVQYIPASQPIPLMFECQAGWALVTRRITVKMIYVFQTAEAKSQKRSQQYGSFQFSYRFR